MAISSVKIHFDALITFSEEQIHKLQKKANDLILKEKYDESKKTIETIEKIKSSQDILKKLKSEWEIISPVEEKEKKNTGFWEIYLETKEIKAKAMYDPATRDCELLPGSLIDANSFKSMNKKIKEIRDKAILNKKIKRISEEHKYVVESSIVFSSPSAAASFVTGYSANGMLMWKEIVSKKSIKDIQNKCE